MVKEIKAALLVTLLYFSCIANSGLALADQRLPNCMSEQTRHNCFGTRTFNDGTTYTGEWKNDKKNGRGKLTGKGFSYQGEFKNDNFDGYGTLTRVGGSYSGFWSKGVLNGEGTIKLPGGQVYEGYLRNSRMNGFGIYTEKNGNLYVGGFQDNKFSGEGVYVDKVKPDRLAGIWENGTLISATYVDLNFLANFSGCLDERSQPLKKVTYCTDFIEAIKKYIAMPNNPKREFSLNGRNYFANDALYLALGYRSWAYSEIGDFPKSITDTKARMGIKLEASDYVRLASDQLRSHDCQGAISNLNVAVNSDPNGSYVKNFGYMHRAIAHFLCDDIELVRADLNRTQATYYQKIWTAILFGAPEFNPPDFDEFNWEQSLYKFVTKAVLDKNFDIRPLFKTSYDQINRFSSKDAVQIKCEGYFYVGFAAFMNKSYDVARRYLASASSYCPQTYFERAPAVWLSEIMSKVEKEARKDPSPTVDQTKSGSEGKSANSGKSSGTGFRVSKGRIVTNFHVVDGCKILTVNRTSRGMAKMVDRKNDLALIELDNDSGETAQIRTNRLRLNETVTVAGFPLEGVLSGLAVTSGNVSRLNGFDSDSSLIQISAPVQPGNSGGPLVDVAGNVIGVVVSKLDALKVAIATGDVPQNVNFSINLNTLRTFLDANYVDYRESSNSKSLSNIEIGELVSKFTVLIECQK